LRFPANPTQIKINVINFFFIGKGEAKAPFKVLDIYSGQLESSLGVLCL
jgi:hypothetical protein